MTTSKMTKSKIVVVFPVFNGARTLEKSLQCIADQDFTGFKAIILENVSTDDSLAIAEAFCQKDHRFSIIRNDDHLSAVENFEKAIRIGADYGEYFCLRACDDMSSDDFISSLVNALDNNPSKLLAACATKILNVEGHSRIKTPSKSCFDFPDSYARGEVPRNLTFPAEWIYNVFRSDGAPDILLSRWYELNNPWCLASYSVFEIVVRDLVVFVNGPSYNFYEGSDSQKRYGAKTFKDRLNQRLSYTFGCFKLKDKLPKASIVSRILFFRMCWNDARRKTRYKLFWIF
jgi:glycosyltransferase involved in cell wall biosynthesis